MNNTAVKTMIVKTFSINITRRTVRAAMLLLTALAAGAVPATAAPTVVVNGAPVVFAQPPVEQAGRVFVPLRGVFERLGASVVYQNGLINATGSGHDISLHVGSTSATVDGKPLFVDSAPYLAGDTTLVPLRFISQALGASVRYDDATDTVTIASPVPPPAPVRPVRVPPPAPRELPPPGRLLPPIPSRLALADRSPATATNSSHPAVSAAFSEPVDPNTVRIQLDGRDVEQNAYVSASRFQFETPELPPGAHAVRVFGRTVRGETFDRTWAFTSGTDRASNVLSGLLPPGGAMVGEDFIVSGRTLPGSRVRVAVGTSILALGGIFRVGLGTFERVVTADGSGYFRVPVHIEAAAGGSAAVFVQSTSPSGSSATRRLSLRT